MYGPPNMSDGLKKPTKAKEVPAYIGKVIKGFFSRYFYIFKLVGEASPAILVVMSIATILNGVFPVLSAYITSELLNELVEAYNGAQAFIDTALIATGSRPEAMEVLEHVFIDNPENYILNWIILELIYLVVRAVISNGYNAFVTISGEKVANHIKVKIISKAKEMDMAQFDLPEFYEKFENASREATFRPIQIINASFTMVSNLISMISFIVVLGALSPFAPLIIIVMALPAAVVRFIYGRKNFLYMRRRSRDRRQMEYYAHIMTNKDLAKEVRMFNLSDTFIGKFKDTFSKYFKGLKKLVVAENVWHIVIAIATALVNAVLFLYVAVQVCNGNLQVGDYSFYSGSLTSIITCVGTIVSATATIYQGTLFIDNVIEFNNIKPQIQPATEPALPVQKNVAHTIEFKNVSFAYPGSDKLVIDNVSFTLEPGTTNVLVGLNGAGKTTLIKLLTRLYDPTSGVILLDGVDIKNYDLEELYELYGTIFQDFGKYAVSVEENIAFGDVDAEIVDEKIETSAKQSGANDFIEALPNKYKTSLMKFFDEDGTELSIGQWQKLSVARAFYSDSEIMILDEPTASLDAMAEQQIFKQFEELTQGKTSLFVSHRLSSATIADKIIVVEHGKIIEEGNHKELMSKKGKYYELFTTQAKRYIETNENESEPALNS